MNRFIFVVVSLLVIAVISVLSFGVFQINDSFAISYSFLIIAVLIQLLPVFLTGKLKDSVYQTALFSVSTLYLIAQIIVSILGYMSNNLSPIFIVTISSAFCITDIIAIIILVQLGIKGERTKRIEYGKSFFIDDMICKLEKIKGHSKDNDIICLIDRVIEKVRYSNLNSTEAVSEIELKISQEIERTGKLVSSLSKNREIQNSCDNIVSLLEERNALCKLYK